MEASRPIPTSTAIPNVHSPVRRRPTKPRRRRTLWIACACLPGVIACAASHDADRTALREDHEQCLQDARSEAGRVSYRGYQACMDTRGWPAVDVLPPSHQS